MSYDIFLRDSSYQTQWQYAETRILKCNLNASLRTIGVISTNQMRKSLSISPNYHSQYIACRLLWITGNITCNYVHPYMDLGAFTCNSQDLKKYVCLVNVQSLIYREQSRDCLVCLHKWFGWKSTTCGKGLYTPDAGSSLTREQNRIEQGVIRLSVWVERAGGTAACGGGGGL